MNWLFSALGIKRKSGKVSPSNSPPHVMKTIEDLFENGQLDEASYNQLKFHVLAGDDEGMYKDLSTWVENYGMTNLLDLYNIVGAKLGHSHVSESAFAMNKPWFPTSSYGQGQNGGRSSRKKRRSSRRRYKRKRSRSRSRSRSR